MQGPKSDPAILGDGGAFLCLQEMWRFAGNGLQLATWVAWWLYCMAH